LVKSKKINPDFYDFIQNKNNHKFNNILNFYEKNFERYNDNRDPENEKFLKI